MNCDGQLVYLSTPYTHADGRIQRHRYLSSLALQSKLLACGVNVFNPLAHTVDMAREFPSPGFEDWLTLDLLILEKCDELLIFTLDGWVESNGVKREIFHALELGKPISVVGNRQSDISRFPKIRAAQQFYGQTKIFEIEG